MKASAEGGAWHIVTHEFPKEHPTAAGHFPGNPIIPGAMLLDYVLRAIAQSPAAQEIRVAKFLRPVRPGDGVVIRWRTLASGEVAFECSLVATGEAALVGSLVGSGQ